MSRERPHNTQTSRISFNDLQIQIEDLKQKRDESNRKTKNYITELIELEDEITNLLKIAKVRHKKKRDYWNDKVKLLKDKKIEYKDMLESLIGEKRKHRGPKKDNKEKRYTMSSKQIERKIDNLERQIETEKLDIAEENAIVDKIREFAEMKQNFQAENQNSELLKIERKIEIVKINLNKIYEKLNKWSDKSQENHSKMLEVFQKVDELKEKKKSIEEDLIENKKIADRYHEQYIKVMNQQKKSYKGKKPYRPSKSQHMNHRVKRNELLAKIRRDKLATALEKQKSGQKLNLFEARLILERPKE